MSDTLRNWPEKISLFCISDEENAEKIYIEDPIDFNEAKKIGHIDWEESAYIGESIYQEKYIHVTLAKKREEQLMESMKSIVNIYLDVFKTYIAREDIYKRAGLEELK